MQVVVIGMRWIEVLAELLLAWRERQRERRSLIVREKSGQLVIQQGARGKETEVPPEAARAARGRFVIFELPADKIVTRRANVPARSREFLAGLVHNQIELLSPWPADQAVYGFDAELSGENAVNLDVRMLITPRTVVIDALNKLIPEDRPRLSLPDVKFHRSIGEYADKTYSVRGELLAPEAYQKHLEEVLPNAADKDRLAAIFKEPDWVMAV